MINYQDAGVNIAAGNETVTRIKKDVEATFGPGVISGLGGFAGLFAPRLENYQQPVFVSGTEMVLVLN